MSIFLNVGAPCWRHHGRQSRHSGMGRGKRNDKGWDLCRGRSFACGTGTGIGLGIGKALALLLLAAPGSAIPRLDLSGYPKPAAGDRRWVIQLPGVLRPSADQGLSANPADWRVQLIVGRMVQLDCNVQSFGGKLRPVKPAQAGGPVLYRVTDVGPLASTRKACPPDQPRRSVFLPMAGKPFVVPYNASLPIVVDAPRPLELRWRLWKAERAERPAQLH